MNCGKARSQAGISLLEVLISMIILAVGILGLAPLLVLSIDVNTTSKEFSIATQLAKEKLEFYEAEPTITGVPKTETESDLQGRFSRVTVITDHATDSLVPENRYKVVVDVSWNSEGQAHSTGMATLINKE
jgi:type IV pilus modification protein PilV